MAGGKPTAPAKKAELTTDQGIQKGRDENGKWQQGMNKANEKTGLATQMSHRWIADKIASASTLIPTETVDIKKAIRDYRNDRYTSAPYHRWIFMVTGRQKHRHETSKTTPPHVHEIQRPIVVIPDNLLPK